MPRWQEERGGRPYRDRPDRNLAYERPRETSSFNPRYDTGRYRAPMDHWHFGFGYDLTPPFRLGAGRREYARDYGTDDLELGPAPNHRGRGPQGYRRADARIGEDVHDRLTEDRHLDASEIDVSVQDGEVTLSGKVDSRGAKHRAEHLVEDLAGVRHVQNNLRIDEDVERNRRATAGAAAALGENSVLADQAAGKS